MLRHRDNKEITEINETYAALKDMQINWTGFFNNKRYLLTRHLPDKINYLQYSIKNKGG